jgi:hypothetical protein
MLISWHISFGAENCNQGASKKSLPKMPDRVRETGLGGLQASPGAWHFEVPNDAVHDRIIAIWR